ncbi:hypothetical protein D5018_16375 [Parashewanella curva]|uniref:Uncharacterized protein n=1 Tax=Parashewanella curva TaxID=2338552 RepID=A0A3L8PTI0_9GAMM|nr:hypothetical protein [Parashewanella curva]RLV58596.1 hypothetical protein D5018_16375 [Parashewanella curva]
MTTASVSTSVWDGVLTSAATGAGFGLLGGPVASATGALTGGGGHLFANVINQYVCERINRQYHPLAEFMTRTGVSTLAMTASGQLLRPAIGVVGNLVTASASKLGGVIATKAGASACNYFRVEKSSWVRTGVNMGCGFIGGNLGAKVAGAAIGETITPEEGKDNADAPQASSQAFQEPEVADCVDDIGCLYMEGDPIPYTVIPEQKGGNATLVERNDEFGGQCLPIVECDHSQHTNAMKEGDICFALKYRVVDCSERTFPDQKGIILDLDAPEGSWGAPVCKSPIFECQRSSDSDTIYSDDPQEALISLISEASEESEESQEST